MLLGNTICFPKDINQKLSIKNCGKPFSSPLYEADLQVPDIDSRDGKIGNKLTRIEPASSIFRTSMLTTTLLLP